MTEKQITFIERNYKHLTDVEMGEMIGLCRQTIGEYRKYYGLHRVTNKEKSTPLSETYPDLAPALAKIAHKYPSFINGSKEILKRLTS